MACVHQGRITHESARHCWRYRPRLECHEQPAGGDDRQSALIHARAHTATVLAALVGANVGPLITPFGSLATMLVVALARREDVEVHTGRLVLLGLLLMPLVVVATTLALAFAIRLTG